MRFKATSDAPWTTFVFKVCINTKKVGEEGKGPFFHRPFFPDTIAFRSKIIYSYKKNF